MTAAPSATPRRDPARTLMVLEIQRLSTEDGPGLRTTVFLKGCSLRCTWCHNPESISPRPQIQWIDSRCMGCGSCLEACPRHALCRRDAGHLRIDRDRCQGCGACVDACPTTALDVWGRPWDVDDLAREVLKDQAYFEGSRHGGVTLSGGEALLYAQAGAMLLQRLKEAGVHTAVDTCGMVARAALEQILPWTDLILYDLKLMDPAQHAFHTGADNARILDNVRFLASSIRFRRQPAALWIRTPLIPGATDDPANLRAIGAFIAAELSDVVERWDLCAFNNLCRDKYLRLDLDWPYRETLLLSAAHLQACGDVARHSGVDPTLVRVSGAARIDKSVLADRPPEPVPSRTTPGC